MASLQPTQSEAQSSERLSVTLLTGQRFFYALSFSLLEIVANALFGPDIQIDIFGNAWGTLLNSIAQRIRSPWLPLLGLAAPKNREFRTRTRALHEMVNQLIRSHHKAPASDWLSQLAARLDIAELENTNQLRDEVITLLIAGHETTAMLLAWSLYLVASHPDVLDQLAQEAETVLGKRQPTHADLADLPVSLKVLQEAMRLYPPVWVMFRKTLADDYVLGYKIPAGSSITISPFVTHRHPDYWPDPERFNPDRRQAKEAYFPFGGGARQCIGQHFALLSAQLVLVMITQRYDLQLTTKTKPSLDHQITLKSKESICMIPSKRK